MKIKRTIKIISKKIIKSFKRVLIFFLPRKIIDYLKRVEKAIILALKKLIYLTANSFRNLTWKKNSILFNGDEYISYPFTISNKKSKQLIFNNLLPGDYELTVSHNDKYLHSKRNSFYVSLDFTTNGYSASKFLKQNLSKRESRTNLPFDYLGHGRFIDGIYKQTVLLNLQEDIKHLKVNFRTQFDRSININEVILRDVSPLSIDEEIKEKLKHLPSSVLVYGDININTIDGSSIWLTSLVNILSRFTHVILLSKDNIRTESNVLKNINSKNVTTLFPSDFRHYRPFSIEKAVEALKMLDNETPVITGLVTRGVELALEVQKDKYFCSRRYVYVTDFYLPNPEGIILKQASNTLEELLFNTDYLLYQTKEIERELKKFVINNKSIETIYLPPTVDLPNSSKKSSIEVDSVNNDVITIGYAGKIQPNWGVLELIEEVRGLISKGINIELHIASGKISNGDGSYPGFKQIVSSMIKKESFIKFYNSLSRNAAQDLISQMDYVWCYRPASFENSTLEVSTKLIEAVAAGHKAICYPSDINKQLLGEEYPFFIQDCTKLGQLLSFNTEYSGDILMNKILQEYSFDSVANSIKGSFTVHPQYEQKVLFAGNDLKFISPFISNLKKHGVKTLIDSWDWGSHSDLDSVQKKMDWADIIFCEWGLANAVWYSNNNHSQKPLYVRIHAQEVREKARKFAKNINFNNVTKFIFVSETIRDKAIELYNWPINKTCIIPNFIEPAPFDNKSFDDEIKLGMVGIVPKTKRLDRAIDLLEQLLNQGLQASLHIKGHRPENLEFMHAPGRANELEYYYALYDRIENNPILKDNIHYYGWGNDVPLWYRNINVILSPSDNESFHYALADGVVAGALPFVWAWEGAEKIYPSDWVTSGEVDDLINRFNNHNRQKCINNRNELLARYGKEKIFSELESTLFGKPSSV